jgi:hypothetical protein
MQFGATAPAGQDGIEMFTLPVARGAISQPALGPLGKEDVPIPPSPMEALASSELDPPGTPDEASLAIPDEVPLVVPDEAPLATPDGAAIEVPDALPLPIPDEAPLAPPDEAPLAPADEIVVPEAPASPLAPLAAPELEPLELIEADPPPQAAAAATDSAAHGVSPSQRIFIGGPFVGELQLPRAVTSSGGRWPPTRSGRRHRDRLSVKEKEQGVGRNPTVRRPLDWKIE